MTSKKPSIFRIESGCSVAGLRKSSGSYGSTSPDHAIRSRRAPKDASWKSETRFINRSVTKTRRERLRKMQLDRLAGVLAVPVTVGMRLSREPETATLYTPGQPDCSCPQPLDCFRSSDHAPFHDAAPLLGRL